MRKKEITEYTPVQDLPVYRFSPVMTMLHTTLLHAVCKTSPIYFIDVTQVVLEIKSPALSLVEQVDFGSKPVQILK